MSASLDCRDERRRQLIRERKLNGIDYVDVRGKHLCVHFLDGIPAEFLPPAKGTVLSSDAKAEAMRRIVIRGGHRVTDIHVLGFGVIEGANRYEESCLGIDLDKEGDWSEYTLCFVELKDGLPTDTPLQSLDPRYACIDFTFKIDCPAEVDCKDATPCPPPDRPHPAISYLAKDYSSFRQLILDRLSLTMPQWRERHVPDVGIAIVEVLAYVGDYLSYYQDSVGTEQYLDTARQRISVRRHARLVDYAMHEGCNARAFLDVQVRQDTQLDPHDLSFLTRPPNPIVFEPLMETAAINLVLAHNLIPIYTWGDRECCLPKGAMRATLLDELQEHDQYDAELCKRQGEEPPCDPPPPNRYGPGHVHYDGCGCEPPPKQYPPRPLQLKAGDFLLFEELACAGTVTHEFDGQHPLPDVDRTHRHVVRLTKVRAGCDALRGNRVLEVEWGREDALPFPICVSAIGTAPDCDYVTGLAVARGNIVLVDHGMTIRDEPLAPVPEQPMPDVCDGEDELADVAHVAGRYRPVLRYGPLTFAQPLLAGASASATVAQDPRAALPEVVASSIPPAADAERSIFTPADLADIHTLAEALFKPTDPWRIALRRRLKPAVIALLDAGTITDVLLAKLDENLRALLETWTPLADLLDSDDEPNFVAEMDDFGLAHLRFGDGSEGRPVDVGMSFVATYRAGNGRAGLVGPEMIVQAVFRSGTNDAITSVRNPLPSRGAIDPEPVAEVKMYAPTAFRKSLERAVTAADYATLAQYLRYPQRNPRVQSAAANLRFNGSWYEADVAVDAFGSAELDPVLRRSIAGTLHPVRRMGHDLRLGAADIVPLRIELDLCVKLTYLRAHVVSAVRDALSNRVLPDGARGFFHPDNLTFGQAVYVSRIVAAVMAVDGVAEVEVVRLDRLAWELTHNPDLDKGLLKLGPTEVARLDNDPAAPENGLLSFHSVRGGR